MISADEKKFFADADPWGFILFARNLDTPDQIRRLTDDLRKSVARQAPILIDQEGGRVARLRPPHWQDWGPPLEQVRRAGPANMARAMWLRYRVIAAELRALGIDVNCAPMLDIPQVGVHAIIENRCYGRDVDTVVKAGRAVADGLLAGGVLPILKHMPGHGRPQADSHVDLPRTDATLADLQAVDFAPFKALADLPMAMTAHVVYEAIDAVNTATLSSKMIDIMRNDIGFDGLLMTDDISMSALSGDLATRAVTALAAGCDLMLHCNGHGDEMQAVAGVVGQLQGAALRRADAALVLRQPPQGADLPALLAELSGLSMVDAHDR